MFPHEYRIIMADYDPFDVHNPSGEDHNSFDVHNPSGDHNDPSGDNKDPFGPATSPGGTSPGGEAEHNPFASTSFGAAAADQNPFGNDFFLGEVEQQLGMIHSDDEDQDELLFDQNFGDGSSSQQTGQKKGRQRGAKKQKKQQQQREQNWNNHGYSGQPPPKVEVGGITGRTGYHGKPPPPGSHNRNTGYSGSSAPLPAGGLIIPEFPNMKPKSEAEIAHEKKLNELRMVAQQQKMMLQQQQQQQRQMLLQLCCNKVKLFSCKLFHDSFDIHANTYPSYPHLPSSSPPPPLLLPPTSTPSSSHLSSISISLPPPLPPSLPP